MTNANQNICVAKILSPHGVKGGVKVKSFMDDPLAIFDINLVDEHGTLFKLKQYGGHGDTFNAMIKGYDDRNAVELLKGTLLYVSRDDLDALDDEDTFYYNDLIGLSVKSGDEVIGTVKSVQNYGAGDVLEISTPRVVKLISFQEDAIKSVDLENGSIEIDVDHLL